MINADRHVEISKVITRLQKYQLEDFEALCLAKTNTERDILRHMIKARARTLSLIYAWMKIEYLKGD